MKVTFPDRSFVELSKVSNGKIVIALGSAKKESNRTILSVSSGEVTVEQFKQLAESLGFSISDKEVVESP